MNNYTRGILSAAIGVLAMGAISATHAKTITIDTPTTGFNVSGASTIHNSKEKSFDDLYKFKIEGNTDSVFSLFLGAGSTGSFSVFLEDKKDAIFQTISILPGGSFSEVLDKGKYVLEFRGFGSYSGYTTISPVPEPAEWVLMGAGLAFVARMAKKKKDSNSAVAA